MIEEFARDFWKRRAAETDTSIRWTDRDMLGLDVDVLNQVLPPMPATLLDLGCGTGDLFLAVLDQLAHVTAVDMVQAFLDRIPGDPRISRVQSPVTDYVPEREFDVAVLFGVVTYLDIDAEFSAYRTLRAAAPHGTVIVKNQCGVDADVDIDGFSEAFNSRYVARYPSITHQAERLREVFGDVAVVRYPAAVNRWENSAHVAFVCS
jgi:trans-aconitate methyltransferase